MRKRGLAARLAVLGLVAGTVGAVGLAALLAGCGKQPAAQSGANARPSVPPTPQRLAPVTDADFPSPTAVPPLDTAWPKPPADLTFPLPAPTVPRPTPELSAAAEPREVAPPACGLVQAIDRSREYLTIDRGSDDGVTSGMTFYILHQRFNSDEYRLPASRDDHRFAETLVARAVVVQVKPRAATAKILGVEQGEPVQVGDLAVQQPF